MRFIALLIGILVWNSAHAAEPIRMGALISTTQATEFTKPTQNGWDMAIAEINAKGGVQGRPLAVVLQDDRGTPEDAVTVTRDLLSRINTRIIFGVFQAHIGAAVSALAKRDGFLFVTPWSGSEQLLWQKGHDLVFRIQPPPQTYGAALAEEAAKLPVTRWATISPNYDAGHIYTSSFIGALKKLRPDIKIVRQDWPELEKLQAGPSVQALKQAHPQAIFTHLYGNDLVAFIREGRKRHLFDGVQVVSVVAGWQEMVGVLGADMPDGWISTGYPEEFIAQPEHQVFAKAYYARYKQMPTFGALFAYVGMHALAQAMEKAHSTDPHKVADALRGLALSTPVGNVVIRSVDGQATIGLWTGKTSVLKGKAKFVDPVFHDGLSYLPSEKWVQSVRKAP